MCGRTAARKVVCNHFCWVASYIMQASVSLVLLLKIICVSLESDLVTFTTTDSFIRVVAYEGSYNLNLSFKIRTWQKEGVVAFHKLSSKGHLTVRLFNGKLLGEVFHGQEDGDSNSLEHPLVVSDGTWHKVEFNIVRTIASLLVENQSVSVVLP